MNGQEESRLTVHSSGLFVKEKWIQCLKSLGFMESIIAMFFGDHNPPHFHARYGRHKVAIRIQDFRVLEGHLPPRALGLVIEWAAMHQEELMNNWELTLAYQPPKKIEPLG